MSRVIFRGPATFNGGVSTADQFSGSVNITNTFNNNIVFLADFNVTSGIFAITVQTNIDPEGYVLSGWVDYATDDIRIFDTVSSALMPQTNAGIGGGETRTGILSAAGVYIIRVYNPFPGKYRLKIQLTSTSVGTLNHIIVTP